MDDSGSDTEAYECFGRPTSKKIPKHGKITDVTKKLKASTHELGENCNCKRLKCFEVISETERKRIISNFNSLGNYNAQSQYLSFRRRLDEIKMVFPICGHSYMECDRNMVLLNQKTRAEMPSDWAAHIAQARRVPSPFIVEECDFRNWTLHFKPMFKPKCPFASRPIRELRVHVGHPDSYNGPWLSSVVTNKKYKAPSCTETEFTHPGSLYEKLIPISEAKYKDLQDLSKFCSETARVFYSSLPKGLLVDDEEDS